VKQPQVNDDGSLGFIDGMVESINRKRSGSVGASNDVQKRRYGAQVTIFAHTVAAPLTRVCVCVCVCVCVLNYGGN
jgi:hypothetical protein